MKDDQAKKLPHLVSTYLVLTGFVHALLCHLNHHGSTTEAGKLDNFPQTL